MWGITGGMGMGMGGGEKAHLALAVLGNDTQHGRTASLLVRRFCQLLTIEGSKSSSGSLTGRSLGLFTE
jgi:hypothetical protein